VRFDESFLGERLCRVSPHRLEFFTLKLAGERNAAIKMTSPRLTVSGDQTATSDLTSEGVRHLASGPVVYRRWLSVVCCELSYTSFGPVDRKDDAPSCELVDVVISRGWA
jgi:hypothetical protein